MQRSAVEVLAALKSGALSAHDHAEQVIEAAGRHANLGAVLSLDPVLLVSQANVADDRLRSGKARLLEGLCLGIKDNIDTALLPTTCGTRAFTGAAATDAPPLERLHAAGALTALKTNLHEIAYGITSNNRVTGAVHNPWKRGYIAGGSSGGTAAAIAAGIVPAGLGTDTGGSVRIPAALCGITGLRPSVRRYPLGGFAPLSSTRDTVGPMARSIADLALLDAIIAGDSAPLVPRAPESIRLGVPRRVLWEGLEAGVADCCEKALEALAQRGVTLVEADPADLWEDCDASSLPIVFYETMRELPIYALARGVSLEALITGIGSPDVRTIFENQLGDSAVTEKVYRAAKEVHLPAMRRNWKSYFFQHQLDGAIFPTTPLTARPLGHDRTVELNGEWQPTFNTYIRNASHATVIGAPGISLPAGLAHGLPVGIEIDGLPGEDRALLNVAAALEAIIPPLPSCPI